MSSTAVEKRLFSLPDTSARLGAISIHSLRRHIASGAIKSVSIGGRVFVPLTEIERIEEHGIPRKSHKAGQ